MSKKHANVTEVVTNENELVNELIENVTIETDPLVQIELDKLNALDARQQQQVADELAKIEKNAERDAKKALKEAKKNEPKAPKERMVITGHHTMSVDKINAAWELIDKHTDRDEIYAIHASDELSKTDKVRRLLELGLPNFAIVVVAACWPAYIFNVIEFDKKRTEREAAKAIAKEIFAAQKAAKQN